MVHQCVSEDLWFRNMLGIDVGAPPLPMQETRLEFIKRYTEDSGKRLTALEEKDEAWWEEHVKFFDVQRSRTWVMTRDDAYIDHRGQLMGCCGCWGGMYTAIMGDADTGGLMQNHAPRFMRIQIWRRFWRRNRWGRKGALPRVGGKAVTERPG